MSDPSSDPFTAVVTTQQFATAQIGPFFAGWAAHFILGGIVCARFVKYIPTTLYERDAFSTKLVLWTIVVIDVACLGLHGEQFVYYATSQDRSYLGLTVGRRVDMIGFFLMAVSAALCGSFMCRRAAKLFNSNLTGQSAFVWCMHALIAVGFGAETACFAFLLNQEYAFVNQLTGAWLWVNTAVDCIITATLYVLLRKRFDAGNPSAIKKVLAISVQTASYTSLMTMTGAILAVAWPVTNIATANALIAFLLPLPSLYALSLIVTLSSREEPMALVVGSLGGGVVSGRLSEKGTSLPAASVRTMSLRQRRLEDEDEDSEYDADSDDDAADEEKAAGAGPRGRPALEPSPQVPALRSASVPPNINFSLPFGASSERGPPAQGDSGGSPTGAEDEDALALPAAGGPRRVSFAA